MVSPSLAESNIHSSVFKQKHHFKELFVGNTLSDLFIKNRRTEHIVHIFQSKLPTRIFKVFSSNLRLRLKNIYFHIDESMETNIEI